MSNLKKEKKIKQREHCYTCYRPTSSCMCAYTYPIETESKFVILMHPKEFKKTKNNTGRLTHLNLKNSEIIIGEDFTHESRVNELIQNYNCYLLYPHENSIVLNSAPLPTDRQNVIFIVDATWACSKKVLRLSKNLQQLKKISFLQTKTSNYRIKEQPKEYCLSTIESTLLVLEYLNRHNLESLKKDDLNNFLDPFEKVVEYQLKFLV